MKDKKKTRKPAFQPKADERVLARSNPQRIALYLPPVERAQWEQALGLSSEYTTISGMVRGLVQKYLRALLKQAAKECPT